MEAFLPIKLKYVFIKTQDNTFERSLSRRCRKRESRLSWGVALYRWLHVTARDVVPLSGRHFPSLGENVCASPWVTVAREIVLGLFSLVGTFWAQPTHGKWRKWRSVNSWDGGGTPHDGPCPHTLPTEVPEGPRGRAWACAATRLPMPHGLKAQ